MDVPARQASAHLGPDVARSGEDVHRADEDERRRGCRVPVDDRLGLVGIEDVPVVSVLPVDVVPVAGDGDVAESHVPLGLGRLDVAQAGESLLGVGDELVGGGLLLRRRSARPGRLATLEKDDGADREVMRCRMHPGACSTTPTAT
jgi:hypothetical protein